MRKKCLLAVLIASIIFAVPVFSKETASHRLSLVDINQSFLEEKQSVTEWGRDPFILPVRPAGQVLNSVEDESGKSFSLSAIIYRNGEGSAIINHRILRQGDHIEGMIVQEILSDRVILRGGSRLMELKVDQFLGK
ncbi:MAG: hypothetical protein EPO39_05870 [Candidatus Manganitrophaceae bacterium]|nr:MAG: hypothetical protein EPO39_05870 [Candidatus Manganitrophaceae bacterium]